jgi:hypothetical protein
LLAPVNQIGITSSLKILRNISLYKDYPVAQARIFSEPPSTDQFISIIQIATDISINFSNLVEILDLENKIEDY